MTMAMLNTELHQFEKKENTKNIELIEIKPIEIKKTTIRIVGDTPLIMHAWSEEEVRYVCKIIFSKSESPEDSARWS